MMQFIVRVLVEYESRRPPRGIRSIHNSSLQETTWLLKMLHRSSLIRCWGLLRMQRDVFIQLCGELRSNNYLLDSRYVSVYEQIAMLLLTVWHNCRNFLVQDVFQHSDETISRHFTQFYERLLRLQRRWLSPALSTRRPLRYWGIWSTINSSRTESIHIDVTHIPAMVPTDQAVPYRSGRKNEYAQNVMIVCTFDMWFTWIWPVKAQLITSTYLQRQQRDRTPTSLTHHKVTTPPP